MPLQVHYSRRPSNMRFTAAGCLRSAWEVSSIKARGNCSCQSTANSAQYLTEPSKAKDALKFRRLLRALSIQKLYGSEWLQQPRRLGVDFARSRRSESAGAAERLSTSPFQFRA